MHDFVIGANKPDFHLAGVNWGRDLPEPDVVADIRKVVAGDASPDGKGTLQIARGIEVGHVFALGQKYSRGDGRRPCSMPTARIACMQMGCYGIGVIAHRRRGDRAEPRRRRHHLARADGAMARGDLHDQSEERCRRSTAAADGLYRELDAAGIETVLDDRGLRPGAMFADIELIGIPHRVVVSERGLAAGTFEYRARRDSESRQLSRDELRALLRG